MMNRLTLASLLLLPLASAIAAPAATERRVPPPQPTCSPSGVAVVELDELDRTTSIYRDGSWTRDLHPNGKLATSPGAHEQRCLGKDVITKVLADIKAAPWTISHPIHCMAMSTARTIVKINGKIVFTERMCNPEALDDKSARLLLEIERLMDAKP
jgi:hypothetical protein